MCAAFLAMTLCDAFKQVDDMIRLAAQTKMKFLSLGQSYADTCPMPSMTSIGAVRYFFVLRECKNDTRPHELNAFVLPFLGLLFCYVTLRRPGWRDAVSKWQTLPDTVVSLVHTEKHYGSGAVAARPFWWPIEHCLYAHRVIRQMWPREHTQALCVRGI